MFRRTIVTSAAVLFLVIAAPLDANGQDVYVLAGLSVPTGDYGDFADTGWLGAAGVTFPLGEAGVWAGAEGLYGGNGTEVDDLSFNPYSVMGIIGYDIPTGSNLSPFVFGGAGLMGLSNGDSDSGFGWQLGAGVGFEGESNITPFLEARYQSASINEATISLFGVEAGVSIGLGD